MPVEGVPKPEGYGPNTPGSKRLIRIGKAVGIDFTYKSKRFPNTVMGHCALEYAFEKNPSGEMQNRLQESLFESYFTDGEDLSSDVVVKVAENCGFSAAEVKSYIENPENQSCMKEKAMKNRSEGVSGVPFFLINNQGMISGAQYPEVLMKTLETADAKFPIPQDSKLAAQISDFP